jgi:predicted acyl esterase
MTSAPLDISTPPWTPRPALFGCGVHYNVAIPMSDGIALRADIHYPTVPETGLPVAGPFPCCCA